MEFSTARASFRRRHCPGPLTGGASACLGVRAAAAAIALWLAACSSSDGTGGADADASATVTDDAGTDADATVTDDAGTDADATVTATTTTDTETSDGPVATIEGGSATSTASDTGGNPDPCVCDGACASSGTLCPTATESDEAAVICALEALRDRTPGSVEWSVTGEVDAADGVIQIREDGAAIHSSTGSELECSWTDATIAGMLRPPGDYEACLADPDPSQRLNCVTFPDFGEPATECSAEVDHGCDVGGSSSST